MRNVFFDFDGTLVELLSGQGRGPRNVAELVLSEGAEDFLRFRLNCERAFIVSNQPDISRGLLSEQDWTEMIEALISNFQIIDGYVFCPHENMAKCSCRKPNPGMLTNLIDKYSLDPKETYIVGDTWIDILAGYRAGINTILLQRAYSWLPTSQGNPPVELKADRVITSFLDL